MNIECGNTDFLRKLDNLPKFCNDELTILRNLFFLNHQICLRLIENDPDFNKLVEKKVELENNLNKIRTEKNQVKRLVSIKWVKNEGEPPTDFTEIMIVEVKGIGFVRGQKVRDYFGNTSIDFLKKQTRWDLRKSGLGEKIIDKLLGKPPNFRFVASVRDFFLDNTIEGIQTDDIHELNKTIFSWIKKYPNSNLTDFQKRFFINLEVKRLVKLEDNAIQREAFRKINQKK